MKHPQARKGYLWWPLGLMLVLLTSWGCATSSANVAQVPERADDYFRSGIARLQQGNLGGGIADLTKALEIDPQCVEAYLARALARSYQGDLAGVRADLTKVLEINPRHADAYRMRGAARFQMGDRMGGREDLH